MIPAFIAHAANKKRNQSETRVSIDGSVHKEDKHKKKEKVLQSKGGSAPQPASPMAEARAQVMIDKSTAKQDRRDDLRTRRLDEQDRQKLLREAGAAQRKGYSAARNRGINEMAMLGFDDNYGILDAYNRELDSIRNMIGNDVTDVSSYYSDGVFDDIYSSVEGRERRNMMNDFDADHHSGFAENYFGSDADDNIISELTDTRKADALNTLDQALARGQISDSGYARALQGLNEQSSTAQSTLQGLGSDVLAGYRGNLEDYAQDARDRIGNFSLGSVSPTTGFDSGLEGRVDQYNANMRGNILDALGDTSLFDTSSLLTTAGAYQGVTNTPATTPVTSNTTTTTAQQSPTADKRTTGTSGSF